MFKTDLPSSAGCNHPTPPPSLDANPWAWLPTGVHERQDARLRVAGLVCLSLKLCPDDGPQDPGRGCFPSLHPQWGVGLPLAWLLQGAYLLVLGTGKIPSPLLSGSLILFFFSAALWLSDKEPACQCQRCRRLWFNPWVGKIPWRRKWQPTPVFLSGKSHG